MKTLLLFALITAFLGSARAADLSGTWRVDQPRPGGVVLRTYFDFTQSDGNLSGFVIINESARLPLRHPHFEGEEGVFGTDWGISYRVRAEGEALHVKIVYIGRGVDPVEGHRVAASELQPPARDPLPDFEPLPPNGLALTPPMGWNSWNHFGDRVDDRIVRETADLLVSSGLAAAGYVYVNIDDTWEGSRDADGNITSNGKFPDMKALADYVHARGLKLGLYSSPGPRTCGGYEGSYRHVEQDAKTYAAWGVDYLKYDWCSASRVYGNSLEEVRAGYFQMGRALAKAGRPVVYSLCEYGMADVGKWGAQVGGNLWRTTGDIQDNWTSMSAIGFSQDPHADDAGPGHWNDPDMLEVGNGGMTTTEYRTHFSLWCLLAAPLMAGHDLAKMSADTLEILTNREVIAIDQDPLGRQARRIAVRGDLELWAKPLQDGGLAIGLFNRGPAAATATLTWKELGLAARPAALRDLWLHRDVEPTNDGYSTEIPSHGVVLLRAK